MRKRSNRRKRRNDLKYRRDSPNIQNSDPINSRRSILTELSSNLSYKINHVRFLSISKACRTFLEKP
uniref:Uncharacterized protein n=1 Tax=Romanomermis culicivorax TaxID=13658 RepID=A0A915ILS2_ROMCU